MTNRLAGGPECDVVIVGAGHNGLVAAFYLARAGARVTVVEANPQVGGACVTEELIPGYRFSTCANVLWGLRPKIARDMEVERRGLRIDARRFLRLLSGGERVFLDRNSGASTPAESMAATLGEISRICPEDAEALPRWQEFLNRLSAIFGPWLLRPPPRLEDLRNSCRSEADREALELALTTPVPDLAARFFRSDLMRNVSAGADLGDGRQPGSGLLLGLVTAMGAYSENDQPVLNGFVRGGMGRLSDLLAEAARESGAIIRTGCEVRQILVEGGRSVGVTLASGETLRSQVVVSNADPKRTFLRLLRPGDAPAEFLHRIRRLETGAAAGLKVHCALSEVPHYRLNRPLAEAQLREATVIISPSAAYQEAAWRAAQAGDLPAEPVVAAFLPSVYDPSLAPPGRFTWSAYVTWVPARPRYGAWASRKEEIAENVFRVMDRYSPNFRRAVLDRVVVTPEDLEQGKGLTDGNIHHVDAVPSQLLWRRPLEELSHYRTPISGLYLCGSGTHPWGEVSGAPGHNAAHVILSDLRLAVA